MSNYTKEYIDKLKDNEKLLNIAMKADNPTFGTNLSLEHKTKIGKKSDMTKS